MLIQHRRIGDKGLFFIEQDRHILAEMSYSMPTADRMIINHTEVGDELRGKNVGFELVKTGVEFARKNKLTIVPLCTFAKKVFDKTPEFRDVL